MIRQEAIEDLKLLRFNHNVMINGTNHTSKALDIAIEALELMETMQQATKASNLIDREDAIAKVASAIWHYPNELYTSLNCFENCQELAEGALNRLPSAEPEVIRCKDCKNYASYWGNCRHWERISTESVLVAENDFCSRAERRTDEQTG